eukprot:TRINITY_DN2836_c0_g1_i2.p4 TRINITY_DN2836_c0_g1~~TRINITY_DN2836_c0_g1_i2.p4  ORF type:complete len:113 (+),score=11.85 TRINITY_DN2836_c0_g1_i2:342-680(+)
MMGEHPGRSPELRHFVTDPIYGTDPSARSYDDYHTPLAPTRPVAVVPTKSPGRKFSMPPSAWERRSSQPSAPPPRPTHAGFTTAHGKKALGGRQVSADAAQAAGQWMRFNIR